MPHPTDKSDAETTLPDPDLNPLLNPLLAAHMGRWAEVYFTSPPEKRAEAVSELLRELEKEAPSELAPDRKGNDAGLRKEIRRREIEIKLAPQPFLGAVEHVHRCDACGHDNGREQKFCGMCGAPLKLSHEDQPQVAEAASIEPQPYSRVEYSSALNSSSDGGHDLQVAPWPVRETDVPRFAREVEPAPYRYRLYVGVAVAVVLVALVYLGWRGTRSSSDVASQSAAARTMPAAPPETANPLPANPLPANPAPQPKATEESSPERQTPAAPVRSQTQAEPSSQDQTTDAPLAPAPGLGAADYAAGSAGQSGSEELALGERYLNGNRNTARDSAQAAQWLWKSVAKGNITATIALSDLYLRGDGVPKNCDQARLLLDAAARKGGAAAAERLRNLQAFGCQ